MMQGLGRLGGSVCSGMPARSGKMVLSGVLGLRKRAAETTGCGAALCMILSNADVMTERS